MVEYLESSSKKYPSKIAIIEEEKRIPYKDLNNYSKQGGTYFIDNNIVNELVLVFMDKGIDTLITFFSSIYAGCYYSLINPELPKSRIDQIIKATKAIYVVTDDVHEELAKKYFRGIKIINVNELKSYKIDEDRLQIIKDNHIDIDPLYVNFTSGSTGEPKGVVISHRSVIDFIDKFTNLFNFSDKDIIANQAPFDFDVSVKDIYSSIRVGATLVIIPRSYFSNPTKLLDYLCDNKVTIMTWAVSALCLITTFHGLDYKVPESVNKIIFSGEVMPIKHLKNWIKHLPDATFVNAYGPTEITCNCTYYVIDKNKEYEKIPIGKPFPNERVILLGENEKEIKEQNKVGEICVIGTCLGLGYYNNLDQTNKVFAKNPNQKYYFESMYHTGDLAYYDSNNDLVFNGRRDFQIKYQGHRIELEEIDKAINSCDSVVRSCTIFDENKLKLYGFYIGDITNFDLKKQLREVLPVYMIPTSLIKVDEFPLTKNGKIDRKRLLELKEDKKCLTKI